MGMASEIINFHEHKAQYSPEFYGYTLLQYLGKFVLKEEQTKELLATDDYCRCGSGLSIDFFNNEKVANSESKLMFEEEGKRYHVRNVSPVLVLEELYDKFGQNPDFRASKYMGLDWMPKGVHDHSLHNILMGADADERILSKHLGSYVLMNAVDETLYTSEPCFCPTFNADFFPTEYKANYAVEFLRDHGLETIVRSVSPVFILEHLQRNYGHEPGFSIRNHMGLSYCEGGKPEKVVPNWKKADRPFRTQAQIDAAASKLFAEMGIHFPKAGYRDSYAC